MSGTLSHMSVQINRRLKLNKVYVALRHEEVIVLDHSQIDTLQIIYHHQLRKEKYHYYMIHCSLMAIEIQQLMQQIKL